MPRAITIDALQAGGIHLSKKNLECLDKIDQPLPLQRLFQGANLRVLDLSNSCVDRAVRGGGATGHKIIDFWGNGEQQGTLT